MNESEKQQIYQKWIERGLWGSIKMKDLIQPNLYSNSLVNVNNIDVDISKWRLKNHRGITSIEPNNKKDRIHFWRTRWNRQVKQRPDSTKS